jgi:hypothetical protein
MPIRARLWIMALIVLCLGTLGAEATEPGPIGGAATRKMLPGRFEATTLGFTFEFTLKRNGAVLGKFGEYSDTGKWDVREDKLCIALDRWTSGSFKCAPVIRTKAGGHKVGPFDLRKK